MDENKLCQLSDLLADEAIKILEHFSKKKTTPNGDELEVVKCATNIATELIKLQIAIQPKASMKMKIEASTDEIITEVSKHLKEEIAGAICY